MNETQPVSEKRPKWIKRIGIAGGAGFVLLIAGYLFATSGTFVKSVVLPQLSAALNAKVTVEDASVGLFSGVSLKKLHVEAGGESLVKTESASLKYSFFDLLSGRVRVSEFKLEKPEVYVVVRDDGSSNLDPITDGMQSAEKQESAPASSGSVDLAINNIALKDARFRFEQFTGTGLKNLFEADQVNIEIDRFGSGLEGNLKMSTRLKHESGAGSLAPTNKLGAIVSAAFKFAFDPALMPTTVSGSGELDVTEATGALSDVHKLAGRLAVDLSATEIRDLALKFMRGEESLGRISVSGPFNAATLGARLKVEVADIGGSVLNLAGGPLGLNFGDTTVNTSHEITVGEGAKSIAAAGKVAIGKFSVKQAAMVTPTMDLNLDYAVAFDQSSGTIDLGRFQMTGRDGGGEFLKANLSQPFKLSLGENGAASGSASALDLAFVDFDLAKWAAISGGLVDSGMVNATIALRGAADAKQVEISLDETIRGLAAKVGTNRVAGIDADTTVKLKLVDLKQLAVDTVRVSVAQAGQRLLALNSAGEVDLQTQNANLGVSLLTDLAAASRLVPLPDVNLAGGNFSFAGRLVSTNAAQSVTGKITLAALTGVVAGNSLDRLGLETTLDVARAKDGSLKLGGLNGDLSLAGNAAGKIAASGNFDPATGEGKAKLAVTGVNQELLRPFVEPALGGARLASLGVNVSMDADYAGGANAAIRGNVELANLVISDPQARYPATPIGLQAAIDAKVTEGKSGINVLLPLLRGTVKVADQDAGGFDVTADFDAAKQAGKFGLTIAGINERLLAPFAGGALGDKSLKSVAVNAKLNGVIDLQRSSTVKGGFGVTNLVVLDPAGKIPANPLAVEVGVNAGMQGKKLNLQALSLTLAPTDKAKNVLTTSGTVDFSDTNAVAANLSVTSDGIDLTPYFDLLSGGEAPAESPAPTPEPAGDPNAEPPPITLPVKNSRIDVRIAKLHLREIEVSDVAVTTAIDRQTIAVSPLRMAVNGGPVDGSVNLNLGLPGHQYDVRLTADRVPIRPALKSFSPAVGATSRGEVVANVLVKGAGRTGRSLQQHLNGHVGFYLTNAMLTIIPESKPQPAATGLGASLKAVGTEFASSGLSMIASVLRIPDLTSSPVTHLSTRVEMGQGAILLKHADVRSDKFMVRAEGVIPIAEVLTNSPLSIPVDMWLSKSAASRLTLAGGDEPFTKLPRFVEMQGTLGAPETKINKVAVASVLLGGTGGLLKGVGGDVGKTVGGILQQGGGEAGNLIQGLGGLLGGKKQSTTNAPPAKTNAPSTDVKKLFRLPF